MQRAILQTENNLILQVELVVLALFHMVVLFVVFPAWEEVSNEPDIS